MQDISRTGHQERLIWLRAPILRGAEPDILSTPLYVRRARRMADPDNPNHAEPKSVSDKAKWLQLYTAWDILFAYES